MIRKGTAVITGGSSGIGAGFAKAFAKQGYDLLLISRDQEELDVFAKEISSPGKIRTLSIDLSKEDEIKKLEAEIAKISDLDVLVNCAGFGINKDFLDEDIQKREDMVTVHDITSMKLTYQALKIMKKNGQGTIINISSLAAFFALGNNPVYAASKIFLNSFSQNLYRIYKKYGIYIQSLCPGFTATNFAKRGGYKFKGNAMKVEDVVKASLSCMRKKRLLCIPGRKNRLLLMLYHAFPRSRSDKIFEHMKH